ncbi:MAG: NAD(P)/FAD-dependent oxidoreductase [Nannocystales bacterium]
MTCDVLVLGGGPAGTAAAISAAQAGLSVRLLEKRRRNARVPGETLHPGVEPLLSTLGVAEAVHRAGFPRHRGVWVEEPSRWRFQAYGADPEGPWEGFQVDRAVLHGLLLARAEALGVAVERGVEPVRVLTNGGKVEGVASALKTYPARWTMDASGHRGWLSQQLGIPVDVRSPTLMARFGWHTPDPATAREREQPGPSFRFSEHGWDWSASVSENREAWVQLRIGSDPGGIDQTWTLRRQRGGPGYSSIGDAALRLDPSSSHGVMRALMTGMYAAHLVTAFVEGRASAGQVSQTYEDWTASMFQHDAAALRDQYLDSRAGPAWRAAH